jgi:multidrug efflux pump subunit AcrB
VLYDAFGQREVSTMYTGLNQYFVVMEVRPSFRLSPDSLNNIYIKTQRGRTGAAGDDPPHTSLPGAFHCRCRCKSSGQYPAVTLTFNLAPNVALGDAVTALEKAQREMGMPSECTRTFQGTAQAFQASLKNEPF